MTEARTPINLDNLAAEHDLNMSNLLDLVRHIEDYASNELPLSKHSRTLSALAFAATKLASKASDEAEELNVQGNALGLQLMAMPDPGHDHEIEKPTGVRSSYLTDEEIDLIARALSGGLDGYLRSVLVHPENEGLRVE
jgi:hypothetical protein